MSDEREHLENLIKSPGWLLLRQWAAREWDQNFLPITFAASTADDHVLAIQVRAAVVAKNAMRVMLDWPAARLKALSPKGTDASAR